MILNFSDQKVRTDKNLPKVFLAGPTSRNSSFKYSWRARVCSIFKDLGFNGILYIPEYEKDSQIDYMNQVMWERKALESSDIIMFWIDRDMKTNPGLTTNVEFGAWTESNPDKVRLGYPLNSEKMQYLDWFYGFKTGRVPISNLRLLIEDVLNSL